jgi:hypothetical protein
MKRTIFLNGRRRTLRALMFGAAVALLAVPVAQAQLADASDRGKKDVLVIPYLSQGDLAPALAHDMDDSVVCTISGCVPRTVGLPNEDLKAIQGGPAYFRADDFAPPRNVEVSVASGGVDWSETGIWLAVGLAGALGLLGLGLVANRSRVRVAHS